MTSRRPPLATVWPRSMAGTAVAAPRRAPHRAAARTLVLIAALVAGCGGSDSTAPPPSATNHAPSFPSISSSSVQAVLFPAEQVLLTATATDADGDALTFTWSVSSTHGGTVAPATGSSTTYTAGSGGAGSDVVTVTVSDGQAQRSTPTTLTVGTPVGGTLTPQTTWTSAQSPYVLTDDVTVAAKDTLHITAGVQVVLRVKQVGLNTERTKIVVNGGLVARGTASSQVVFKGGDLSVPNQTQHDGVQFLAGSTGELIDVRIERGSPGISYIGGGTLTVYACRVTQCGAGIQVGDGSTLRMRRTLVDNSAGDGIVLGDGTAILRESTLRDNGGSGVSIRPVSIVSSADVDSCNFDENGASNLLLRDICTATVNASNFFKAPSGTSVLFSGVPGPVASVPLDLNGCYWGLLSSTPTDSAAVTAEIRQNYFSNGTLRAFDVWPALGTPIALPNAP